MPLRKHTHVLPRMLPGCWDSPGLVFDFCCKGRLTNLGTNGSGGYNLVTREEQPGESRHGESPKVIGASARTGSGIRTHTPFRTTDFESVASTVPPSRLGAEHRHRSCIIMVRVGRHRNDPVSIETKLFKLNDTIEALRREENLVAEELDYHRHIDDDAQRDAAVSDDWQDRAFARDTSCRRGPFRKSLSRSGRAAGTTGAEAGQAAEPPGRPMMRPDADPRHSGRT